MISWWTYFWENDYISWRLCKFINKKLEHTTKVL